MFTDSGTMTGVGVLHIHLPRVYSAVAGVQVEAGVANARDAGKYVPPEEGWTNVDVEE